MAERVLFVCLGNICRSPTAEAVFRQRVQAAGMTGQIDIDSAGTGDWHIGKAPDRRSQQFAARFGYDLSPLRARQVSEEDFREFDYILAMDLANLADLQAIQPPDSRARLELFLAYSEADEDEVPDPYYGGDEGFLRVLQLVESASDGLLQTLRGES